MTEKEIYIEIAERFIYSCAENLDKAIDIQEFIGFGTYHAFESIGGAFNTHIGQPVPKGHEKKINTFVLNYRRQTISRIPPERIASLAIILNAMRNKFLYPEDTPLGFKAPKQQISLANARDVTSRVNGIIRALKAAM